MIHRATLTCLKAPASPREGLWLTLALALLACLPFFLVHYPQMDDYPAHLARYHIMLDGGRDPDLARYYAFTWHWSGNLGVDILIRPLATLLGLERAAWLIAALIPLLTGLAIISVEWSLRGRAGIGSVLAMMTIWSPSLRMGFLNYTLSLALALFAFALWVQLRKWRWRGMLFVPVSLAIWLCHMSGWGVLGLMVLGYEWRERGSPLKAALVTWPLWPPLAAIALTGNAGAPAGLSLNYGPDVWNYKKDILAQALRGDSRVFDIVCVGLLILVMVEGRSRRWLDWRIITPALLILAAALVMPRHLGGGDFADARLVPVFLMLGCLAINARPPRALLLLACVPVLVRLALLSAAWHSQSQELDQALKALDQVPAGARIASAVANDTERWSNPVFSHVGDYATLNRNALVNAHFAIPGVHMLEVKHLGAAFADPSQQVKWRAGESVDLTHFKPARSADYLWYVGPRQSVALPNGARVLFTTDNSLLAALPERKPEPGS